MSEDHRGGSVSDAWIGKAMFAGFFAGLIFIVFEVAVAAIMGTSPFGPLRMIGAILLGPGGLQVVERPLPEFGKGLLLRLGNPMSVAGVGLLVHFLLSTVYGGTFGMATWMLRPLSRNRFSLVASATAFGVLLWIVNFYVIAPFVFPWFTMANPVVQFLAHAFFFGTVLGLLLGRLPEETQSKETENTDESDSHSSESRSSEPQSAAPTKGDQSE